VRETLSAIPRTSHFVLGKKQYCCYMTCSTDKHSNHLFGNGATVKELMRGSLSDRDPLLRLLLCLGSKQYNHGSTPLMMCQTAFNLSPSNFSSIKWHQFILFCFCSSFSTWGTHLASALLNRRDFCSMLLTLPDEIPTSSTICNAVTLLSSWTSL